MCGLLATPFKFIRFLNVYPTVSVHCKLSYLYDLDSSMHKIISK